MVLPQCSLTGLCSGNFGHTVLCPLWTWPGAIILWRPSSWLVHNHKNLFSPLGEIIGTRRHLWNSISSLPTLPRRAEVQHVPVHHSPFENSPKTVASSLLPTIGQPFQSVYCFRGAVTLHEILCTGDPEKLSILAVLARVLFEKGEKSVYSCLF